MNKVIILNSNSNSNSKSINNQLPIINNNDKSINDQLPVINDNDNKNKKKVIILNNKVSVIKNNTVSVTVIDSNNKDDKDNEDNKDNINYNLKPKKISLTLNAKNNNIKNEIKVINNIKNDDLNINEIDNELDLIFDTCEKGSNVDNKIILIDKKIKYNDREKEKILKSIVKIPKEHFKRKIDLTVKDDTIDPSLDCTIKGRKEYENKKNYEKLPEKLKELDKTYNKKSLFGNLPAPKNLTERFV